jgi:hypothetical protein
VKRTVVDVLTVRVRVRAMCSSYPAGTSAATSLATMVVSGLERSRVVGDIKKSNIPVGRVHPVGSCVPSCAVFLCEWRTVPSSSACRG